MFETEQPGGGWAWEASSRRGHVSGGAKEVREPCGYGREEHPWVKGLWAHWVGTSEGGVTGMRAGGSRAWIMRDPVGHGEDFGFYFR